MYYVYIIECKDGSLYTGITTNIYRRLSEHSKGSGARFTRARGVKRLLYSEKKRNRSTASKREVEIKSWSRQKKLELIRLKNAKIRAQVKTDATYVENQSTS